MEQDSTRAGVLHEGLRKEPADFRADLPGLKSLPIFNGVDEELARRLVSSFSAQQYRAGSTIVRQGQPTERIHLILRGIVDLSRVEGQAECGVLLLSANDIFMPAAALFEEASLVTARALTRTKLAVTSADTIKWATMQSTQFAFNMMKVMSGHWRMAVRHLLDLNCRTAAQRVAAFLLYLSDIQEGSGPAVLPIAKRHLAARLCVTPETLSRTLQILADHGLHLRGREIVIRDREQIEQFCGPDPYPDRDERSLSVYAF